MLRRVGRFFFRGARILFFLGNIATVYIVGFLLDDTHTCISRSDSIFILREYG